jgi:hypothetical protein
MFIPPDTYRALLPYSLSDAVEIVVVASLYGSLMQTDIAVRSLSTPMPRPGMRWHN